MVVPTARRERELRRRGYRHIAGVDEAGRGAWAGPLVAAAVILPPTFTAQGIRDSKLLTPNARERHCRRILRQAVAWAVDFAPPEAIDRDGLQATNLHSLERAVLKLDCAPDYVLVDAWHLQLTTPHEGIIRGDQTVLSIAAASILAKVIRDRLMAALDLLYPRYAFAKHKGYGTPEHRRRLRRHGSSPLHRQSFQPIHAYAHP